MIAKSFDVFNGIFRWVGGILLGAILLVLLLQIGLRTFSGRGFPWGNEIATYLLVWGVCLSSAVAFWDRSHLVVELLLNRLGKFRRYAEAICGAVAIAFLAVLTFYGWSMVESGMNRTSPALGLPMGYVYLAIPVAGAISIVNIIAVVVTNKPAESRLDELEEDLAAVTDPSEGPELPDIALGNAAENRPDRDTGDGKEDKS